MKTAFKVHKRKIHVYREATALDQLNGTDNMKRDGIRWVYAWSTNAYKTCREATAVAINGKNATMRFTSNFAKD
jgi:hypothetical protein